jgi:WD40 repeat protein
MTRSIVLLMLGALVLKSGVAPRARAEPPPTRTDSLGDPLPAGALARVGTVRFRHLATIITVVYAPDGKSVATGGRDGVVRVWDVATGRQLLRIPKDGVLLPPDEDSRDPHPLPIAYSPDGKRLATPGPDNTVLVHDAATGRAVLTLRGHEKPVAALAFAPDGNTLFAMDRGEAVRVWDADGKERLRIAGRKTRRAGFALAPDGKTIATAGEDGVRLWDAARGTELVHLPRLGPSARSVAFSPDGGTLAVGDESGSVHLWDRGTGRMRDGCDFDGSDHAGLVAFSPDGKALVVGGDAVALYDAATGKQTARFPGPAAAFSPDGRTLAAGIGLVLGFADARTGRLRPEAGHTQPLRALAFAPDGKTLATSAPDRSVRFWDAATGKETTGPRGKALHASGLAFSPDGRHLVAAATPTATVWSNYLVYVWDPDTGKEQPLTFRGHSESTLRVLFAADGKEFFTGSADGDVAVWDPATGKELRRFKDANRRVYDLALSPDGKTLAAGGHAYIPGQVQEVEGAVRLLDAATGQERATLRTHDRAVLGVGFLRDGRTLVTAGTCEPEVLFSGLRLGLGTTPLPDSVEKGEPVVLWELATGLPRSRMLSRRDKVCRMAVSPDGRLAALGCQDGSVRIWDLLAGRERRRFDGHAGAVTVLAFSPDGRVLASGAGDTTVLLWDMSAVPPAPDVAAPDAKELAGLWVDLAADPPTAYRAVGKLAAAPKAAAPFLGERVRPAAAPDAGTVARLLADLDNNSFDERERATTELRRLGDLAGPALRQFLKGAPAPEGRRRATDIVAELDHDLPPREQLRDLRAVEVLEWAGAADELRKVAAGMPEARLTREAKAALGRLTATRP